MAVVEGLKLRITEAALSKLLAQRIEFHQKRVKLCDEKLPALNAEQQKLVKEDELFSEEAEEQFKAVSMANNFRTVNPLMLWTDRKKYHSNRVTVFTFMRDHLISGAEYILTEDDLVRLEVLPRSY